MQFISDLYNSISKQPELEDVKTFIVTEELHMSTYMTKTDIKNFNEAQIQNMVEHHIKEYIKLHSKDGVTSTENFYSLLLKAAISLENVCLVKNILERIKSLKIVSILTSTDDCYHNSVSLSLYSDNTKIIDLIDSFIQSHKSNLSFKISTMHKQLAEKMILALHALPEGMSLDYCITHFLTPLYEENVIDALLLQESDNENQNINFGI
jgi:hypothetical protein